jgi:hypothetical protein
LLVGAIAAASIGAAGFAEADPGARSGHSNSRGGTGTGGDTTGMHHIDPFGYNHADANPLRESEHQAALREHRNRQNPPKPAERVPGDPGTATFTQVPRADGSGWAVCKPQASWC